MDASREKELLDRCRTDPEAFGELYDAHFDAIFRYILHRVGNVTVAQDLTSQTFFKAVRRLGGFMWRGIAVSAWLYRVAGNEVNSYLRRHYRRKKHEEPWADYMEAVNHVSPDQEAQDAEAEVKRNELYGVLNRHIQRLDEVDQSILTLRYFEKKSYGEIAQILGKREGTMRMRASRALDRLKDFLAEEEIDYEHYRETLGTDHAPTGPSPLFQTEAASTAP